MQYSKNSNNVKYYYNLKQLFSILINVQMEFIPVMAKLNFQQPLLQSSLPCDPSEIILICWFRAQETFIIIINVENLKYSWKLLNIFVESLIHYYSRVRGKTVCQN